MLLVPTALQWDALWECKIVVILAWSSEVNFSLVLFLDFVGLCVRKHRFVVQGIEKIL